MILKLPEIKETWLTPLFIILALIMGLGAGAATWILGDPLFLFLGLGGAIALLITLYRVEFGLLLLLFMTFTRFSDVLIAYHGAPSIAKIFVPALLAVVAARWLLFRAQPSPWVKTAVILAIYGLVGVASLLYATSETAVINTLVDYAKDALIAIVVVLILREGITLRRAVWALLLGALFLSALTTFQQFTGTFTNNYWGFAQAESRQIVAGTSDFRLAGPISANYYALILIMIVPLALDRVWHEKNILLRLLAAATLFTSTFSIIFTYSRGGFLALILVAGLMLWHHRTKPAIVIAMIAATLIAYQFVPVQYKERLSTLTDLANAEVGEGATTIADSSFRGRQSEITAAWQMFADHPFIGVGLANYNTNYLDYAEHLGLDTRRQERSAHSLYLEIAAETGVMGIIAFGLILIVAFQHLYAAYHIFLDNKQQNYAFLTWALTVSLIGYLTGSLFLHLSYARYFWLLIGLVIATKYVADNEHQRLQTASTSAEL